MDGTGVSDCKQSNRLCSRTDIESERERKRVRNVFFEFSEGQCGWQQKNINSNYK